MSRYIDADALIRRIQDEHKFGSLMLSNMISEMSTADVREVVHGEWIDKGDSNYYCSECDFPISNNYRIDVLHFCPHCGANMDEREVEDEQI